MNHISHFSHFLNSAIGGRKQSEAAARMGISPGQLSKAMSGGGCERTTICKIVTGISADRRVRAQCMAAHLKDVAALAGSDADIIRIAVRR